MYVAEVVLVLAGIFIGAGVFAAVLGIAVWKLTGEDE